MLGRQVEKEEGVAFPFEHYSITLWVTQECFFTRKHTFH
jgi:hypothetical protein